MEEAEEEGHDGVRHLLDSGGVDVDEAEAEVGCEGGVDGVAGRPEAEDKLPGLEPSLGGTGEEGEGVDGTAAVGSIRLSERWPKPMCSTAAVPARASWSRERSSRQLRAATKGSSTLQFRSDGIQSSGHLASLRALSRFTFGAEHQLLGEGVKGVVEAALGLEEEEAFLVESEGEVDEEEAEGRRKRKRKAIVVGMVWAKGFGILKGRDGSEVLNEQEEGKRGRKRVDEGVWGEVKVGVGGVGEEG